jgi:hypothetical protein
LAAPGNCSQGWVQTGDGAVKQAVSGATKGRRGGDDDVQREGSGVVEGDAGALVNVSSLTASIAKSSGF